MTSGSHQTVTLLQARASRRTFMLICRRSTRRRRSMLCSCTRARDSASTAAAVDAADAADAAEEAEADEEAESALDCLTAVFLGDVNAPSPLIEANVVMAAAPPLPSFASTPADFTEPAAMGDMLRRDRPLPTLPSLPPPDLQEFMSSWFCCSGFMVLLLGVYDRLVGAVERVRCRGCRRRFQGALSSNCLRLGVGKAAFEQAY